jgi:WD40 repeat protein
VPTDFLFRKHGRNSDLENATSLSPDGRLVAYFSGDEIAIWNATTNNFRLKIVGGSGSLIGLHFPTNSRLVFILSEVAGYGRGPLAGFWDLETDQIHVGPPVRESGVNFSSATAFSKDGSRIVTWGYNGGHLLLYGSRDYMSLQQLQFPGKVYMQNDIRFSVAFDAEGKRVAVGEGGKIAAWDLAEQRVLKEVELRGSSNDARVALSRDGRWLATTDASKVVVWDLNRQDSQVPARTLDVACSLTGNNERECIRRLCEKVSPLINEKDLSEILGRFDFQRRKQKAFSEPCAYR